MGLQGGCLPSLRFSSSAVGNRHQSPMGWALPTQSDQRRLSGAGVQVRHWKEKKRKQLIEWVCPGQLIISGWSPSDA